jgi:hypothetical protein
MRVHVTTLLLLVDSLIQQKKWFETCNHSPQCLLAQIKITFWTVFSSRSPGSGMPNILTTHHKLQSSNFYHTTMSFAKTTYCNYLYNSILIYASHLPVEFSQCFIEVFCDISCLSSLTFPLPISSLLTFYTNLINLLMNLLFQTYRVDCNCVCCWPAVPSHG